MNLRPAIHYEACLTPWRAHTQIRHASIRFVSFYRIKTFKKAIVEDKENFRGKSHTILQQGRVDIVMTAIHSSCLLIMPYTHHAYSSCHTLIMPTHHAIHSSCLLIMPYTHHAIHSSCLLIMPYTHHAIHSSCLLIMPYTHHAYSPVSHA